MANNRGRFMPKLGKQADRNPPRFGLDSAWQDGGREKKEDRIHSSPAVMRTYCEVQRRSVKNSERRSLQFSIGSYTLKYNRERASDRSSGQNQRTK